MFLHLGNDVMVSMNDIIAIFDMENTTTARDTREFLRVAQEEDFVVDVSTDLPKSFVVTEVEKGNKVYISPISAVTLQKRLENLNRLAAKGGEQARKGRMAE